MKNILCFGDSNTWGFVPEKFTRFDRDMRWPGALQQRLGTGYHIIEEGLNGRTTIYDDPIELGRCGRDMLPILLETHAPLDLVVLMLGTNDTKPHLGVSAWLIGWGMGELIQIVLKSNAGVGGTVPRVLVVSPVPLGADWDRTLLRGVLDMSSTEKSRLLGDIYAQIASRFGCDFLDAGLYASVSPLDCVHLDAAGHAALASAFESRIRQLLG